MLQPRRPRPWIRTARVLAAVGGGALLIWLRPDRAMRSAAGLAAHNLCSSTFVSGLQPQDTFVSSLEPLMGIAARFVRYDVDAGRRTARASFAGLFPADARFQAGYGCRLDYRGAVARAPPPASPIAIGPVLPVVLDPALAGPLDAVFRERAGAPRKRVKAVLVVRDGRVVAERYARGVDAGTPVLGWSVAKSVTNALVGVLVRQGRMRVDQSALAPEWPLGDPRRALTVEDLLRMQSGLDAPEQGSGGDVVNRMLYAAPDMAGFAARRPLSAPPRSRWEYTSANTLLLDRAVGRAVGGGAPGLRAFADRELFAPLGMRGVTMEFDAAGTFVGSSYLYATARDYARFGMLYLADGVAPDGRRVLPAGWAGWSARSTLGRGYGAGFWTNDGPSAGARRRVAAGFPADGFFASGNLGQRIYVVPSAALVIVRLADSDPPDFGIDDDLTLIAAARDRRRRG